MENSEFRKRNVTGLKRDRVTGKADSLFTGYFKDGVKRIDVVLVIKDDGDQAVEIIKVNFLMSAIKAGLELELEPGTISMHRNLIFIKVHAPDSVLQEYGDYLNMKKYFKESHVEFVQPKRTFIEHIFKFTQLSHEREWIKLVRNNYGIYSTVERSLIVYKILLGLRFGTPENYFGLLRLLDSNIIIDAFALHDGPYFFLHQQDFNNVNARQLLFYFWTGPRNCYKVQPFDLIHEYFGDRIAFFFAYYEFYNHALLIAGIAGIITALCEVFDTSDSAINEEACSDDYTYICPTCRRFDICPFIKLKDYCLVITITNILDNPYTFYYCFFIAVWGYVRFYINKLIIFVAIAFTAFWRRKEYYWIWMWELNENELRNTIRPEYRIDLKNVKRSNLTGIFHNFESNRKMLYRFGIATVVLVLSVITILAINTTLVIFKYWLKLVFSERLHIQYAEYVVLGLFGLFNVVVIIYMQKACKDLSYTLTKFENHRTQDTYERSLIIKLYGFTFVFTFAMFVFFAFIKGAFYTYPSDPHTWYFLWGFGMMSCNPLGCLDEVWVMLMVTIFAKQVFMRMIVYLFRLRSDYSDTEEVSEMPCWEREFKLFSITERFVVEKYKDLLTQFGLVTLFVAAFPLAPICAFLVNVWDVRYSARVLLIGSRRPLLPKSYGLGAWRHVLLICSYAVALTNALTLAMTTKTIQRKIYMNNHDDMYGFLNWTLSIFDVNDYLTVTGPGSPAEAFLKYEGEKPDQYCLYAGFRRPPTDPNKYEHTQEYWSIKFYEALFVLLFEHVLVVIVIILHYVIPSTPRDVEVTMAIEQRLKNIYNK